MDIGIANLAHTLWVSVFTGPFALLVGLLCGFAAGLGVGRFVAGYG